MSIKLMSAIFETEFIDLTDAKGNVTKASTAKSVCLALADHSSDEGEGSYPGLEKMIIKTALTKQCIINTYDSLKYNGIITLMGVSRFGTNNYTVNPACFPKSADGKPKLQVNSNYLEGNLSLPDGVISVYPNHPLTTIESSIGANAPLEWKIAHGDEITDDDLQAETDRQKVDAANLIATGMGINTAAAYNLAYAFMTARGILIPEEKVKGQRKAVKEMLRMRVVPANVVEAVNKLLADNMTVTDLFSVSKTAISLANPPPEQGYNPQGLEVSA